MRVCDPIDDLDGVGGRGRLELGGLYGDARGQCALGHCGHLDVLAIVPFGYPVQPGGQGEKTRKPLGQVAHRERFGQPLE